jgi:hypothetical protein
MRVYKKQTITIHHWGAFTLWQDICHQLVQDFAGPSVQFLLEESDGI